MELALDPQASAPLPGLAQQPSPQAAPSSRANEFWDINGVPSVAQPEHNAAAPDSDFTELEEAGAIARGGGIGSPQKLLAVFLSVALVAVAGYGGYLYAIEERNPIEELMSLAGGGEAAAPSDEPAPVPAARKKAVPTARAAQPTRGSARKVVVGNPYWHLPNAIFGSQPPQERLWTAEEEETWRAGLAHRFSYQRWKTVQDVRQMRLRGSEAILWDALQDKKFWTRAYAAVALAEVDVPVSLQTLDAVMQGARSELIADFFERFTRRCTPGQCYVLRQIVRLMDAKGRIIALTGIARSKDALRDLYLTAATLDPDKQVKKWIASYLASRPIAPERYEQLLAVAQGQTSGDHLLAGVKASRRSLGSGKATSGKAIENSSLDLSTEEDIDKEMEQLGKDAGDVEIYEPEAGPAVKDASDADTFEYAE